MEKKRNLWVIPTDKPSRLWEDEFGVSRYGNESFFYTGCTWKNIYITNDEEIKEGDWHFKNDKMVTKSHLIDNTCKKIILTTDQDLIANGVQAIDDDFLEWFVQNPSCEEVPIIPKLFGHPYIIWIEGLSFKEEPKQETLVRDYSNRSCQTCNLFNANKGGERACELELESECASYSNDKTLKDFWISCLDDESDSVLYKQETFEEAIGRQIVEYCKKYEGTDKYNVAMLAIEFGYQLALKNK